MGFADAIDAGIALMERETGIMFTLDGIEGEFKGVFNAHREGRKLGIGGYGEEIDSVLVVRQFILGSVIPRHGQRCTVEGRRYVIDAIEIDSHTFTLLLKGVNQ